jgi:flagellar biosynthesis chaperone FliJ
MDDDVTGKVNAGAIQQQLATGRKQERIAEDDASYSEQRLEAQRKHLDDLLRYKEECTSGLRSAGNGFSVAQMRDYELLLQHLDVVVEAQQQRLQASQREYKNCCTKLCEVQEKNREIEKLIINARQKQRDKMDYQEDEQKVRIEDTSDKLKPEKGVPGKQLKSSYM